jgi:hypothetical protein
MKKIMFLLFILIAAGGLLYYVQGAPQYSFYKFQKAIKNHDADEALKYVDLDYIIDNAAQKAEEETFKKDVPSDPWTATGNAMGKALFMMMLPSLKQNMKSQLKTAILSYDEKDKSAFGLLKKVSVWNFAFRREGNLAFVSCKGNPSVSFKMARSGDRHWKFIEIGSTDSKNK